MRLIAIYCALTLFASLTCVSAEEKEVSAPFPSTPTFSGAHNYYCIASLGTYMQAWEKDSGKVKRGLYANASHATDKVIIEISDGKLFLFRRDEFESGMSRRDDPMDIIKNTETDLVAIDVGENIKGKTIDVVTLNRKTGLGSWSNIRSMSGFSGNPNMQAYYLVCGSRKE